MGKGGKQKANKSVFKVAGARSLKGKNKAKAVSLQLKKLTEVNKKKTEEVDKLLDTLQDTVRQTIAKAEKPAINAPSKEERLEKINQYNETEESSAHALDKLDKMEV